ncbi:hypothetical protein [Paracraurococcus lichenis]|uniref:Uncharacterized protein n=1 Tax=Paracraurococcus lichenis TaxID=3064888 RepID=A0ABT9E9F5_9PROT|nr:hypothetical protein [Paracraurococcus sp. LOR1-02]MDO9712836.1 hypothetical protein [Paracraurococcus sp. LOR1-02]
MSEAIGQEKDGGACRRVVVHGLLDWSVPDGNLGVLRFLEQDGEDLVVAVPVSTVPRLVMALMEMGTEAARQRALRDAGVSAEPSPSGTACRLLALGTGASDAALAPGCSGVSGGRRTVP